MKIKFDSVSKSFGIITALREISFTVNPGEFIFIVGPSGCGKSTLLKIILGQLRPTQGQVSLGEYDISRAKRSVLDNLRRQIGVIFQDYQLLSDKTIEENIALALDIINYPKHQILSAIDDVIKKVHLESRRHLFPSQLSGGELQRAALARALVVNPKIILADEPTGNLDPENSWNLVKLLKDINEAQKTTIIMTTHNLDIIESLGKRTISLRQGEMVLDTALKSPKKIVVKKKKVHSK